MAKVIVEHSQRSIKERVSHLIDEAEGFGKIRGSVIIKPNICSRKLPKSGATTDPRIVEALIKNLIEEGIDESKILIVESDTAFVDTEKASKKLGYPRIMDEYNVEFVNLSKVESVVIRGKYFDGEIRIPKLLVQDKYYISVAKLKTHCQELISCSLKNQYGCLSTKYKVQFHPYLPELIADLNHIIRPDLGIVDGIFAMEGYGPIKGKPVKMNLMMCSKDLVALDTVACQIIGVNPERVGHIQLCKELGDIEDVDLSGMDISKVKRKFKQDILRHMALVFVNRYLRVPK